MAEGSVRILSQMHAHSILRLPPSTSPLCRRIHTYLKPLQLANDAPAKESSREPSQIPSHSFLRSLTAITPSKLCSCLVSSGQHVSTLPQAFLKNRPDCLTESACPLFSRVYAHSFLRLPQSSSPQSGRLQTHIELPQLANRHRAKCHPTFSRDP